MKQVVNAIGVDADGPACWGWVCAVGALADGAVDGSLDKLADIVGAEHSVVWVLDHVLGVSRSLGCGRDWWKGRDGTSRDSLVVWLSGNGSVHGREGR